MRSGKMPPSQRFVMASKLGLWSVWLSGFLLIGLSLFATQRLPSIKEHIMKPTFNFEQLRHSTSPPLTVTIFSSPKPFHGLVGSKQALAIRSWLALSLDVNVVLFGKDPSIHSFVRSLDSRVLIESSIDFTFLGTPFFHSMVARSQASLSNISVLVDPEIIILPDFISSLQHAQTFDCDWFFVAASPSIPDFPFHLDNTGQHWLREDGKRIKTKKMQDFLHKKQQWNSYGGKMIMAWNSVHRPLHAGILPLFLYGDKIHNQWLINEVLFSEFRFVFDASEVISSYHPKSLSDSSELVLEEERTWENMGNSILATSYGSLYVHPFNFSEKIVKLIKCNGHYIFLKTSQGIVQILHDINEVMPQNLRPVKGLKGTKMSLWDKKMLSRKEKRQMACAQHITRLIDFPEVEIKENHLSLAKLYLPFPLETLLKKVSGKDKTVILAISGNNYRDMLMNWVCRLRHLEISNFIVCALDHEIYQFSLLQGLPVFFDPLAPGNISFNDCHFGTECFQRVTKVKSRLVLQILKLGYNVLLSDVDVYWFKNPLPIMLSFGPSVLVAQSDEFKDKGPINMPRRLNSGFYFARSDQATIVALEKVVKHASLSNLSEQPSFYDILCGEDGVNRINNDKCLEPQTNLTVHFLDRNLFPNGAYHGLWEKKNVRSACKKKGCIVLHNNWINGRKKKLERQVRSGLWDYDVSSRLCVQNWMKPMS